MTRRPQRPGFTVTEVVVALAVLTAASVLVAEAATRVLADRARLEANAAATEAAANVLERARARPWADVTAEWGAAQPVPESMARWPESRMFVTVAPEPARPRVKRVTAEVRWERPTGRPWPAVSLTTLIAARTPEGKP